MPEFFQPFSSATALGLLVLGTFLGITVGAVPGLTGAMLIALTLPLTFSMAPANALILLVAMYVGAVSGGLISATLLRMPGTPAAVMTTLDGWPMARAGRPGRALGLGIGASLAGGVFSWLVLWLLAEPMAGWSTRLGPFEYFSLVVLALAMLAGVSGESRVRGLLAGGLGVLAAAPGMHPATGELRWTLGMPAMADGFKLLPVLIGIFAIGKIISDLVAPPDNAERLDAGDSVWVPWREWRAQAGNLLRSSLIGTGVGILPGVGANIGSLAAYSAARRASKAPDEFGKGSAEGIVASEAANNATVGGALIPLIALGIPGSVIGAVLLGALVIHGLQPGPMLFKNNPGAVHAILGAVLAANAVMAVMMLGGARWLARLAAVPRGVLVPVVLVFCVLGSFALANRWFDVWVMLAFGVVGFFMERWRLPLAAFVIGFVLAPLAEENLCAGLMASGGSYAPLVLRPVSLLFLVFAVMLFWRKRNVRARSTSS